VTPCSLVIFPNISKEYAAHIFEVDEYAKHASVCCLHDLIFDPVDGRSILLCNVGKILTGYMASNSERQYSSFSYLEQLIYNLETYQANLMLR
jgi:hypothetical protein